jgi:hypothetical protein
LVTHNQLAESPPRGFEGSSSDQLPSAGQGRQVDAPRLPPVTIRQGGNGEIILSSEDTAALDRLERLLADLLPAQPSYTVFRVQHASPYAVDLKLLEVFAATSGQATTPLRFVSDATTKSIMVFGAGPKELREIQELVRFYDYPATRDPDTIRKPKFFTLDHANAEAVAGVLKEIYRDLLSANDRALAEGRRNEQSDSQASYYAASAIAADATTPRFRGMLSVGIFPQTKTLVVSAPEFLQKEIAATIRELDQPTASTVTSVVSIDGGVNAAFIAEQLTRLMAPSAVSSRPPSAEAPRAQANNGRRDEARSAPNGNANGNGNRGRNGAGNGDRQRGAPQARRGDR